MKYFSDYKYYFKEFYSIIGIKLIGVLILSISSLFIDLIALSVIIPFIGGLITQNFNEFLPEKIQEYFRLFNINEDYLFYMILISLIIKVLVSLLTNYYKAALVRESITKLRDKSLKTFFYSKFSSINEFKPAEVEFALSSEFQNIGLLIKTLINNLSRGVLFIGYLFFLFLVLNIKFAVLSILYSLIVFSFFYLFQNQVKENSKRFSLSNNKYLEFLSSGIDNLRYLNVKSIKKLFLEKILYQGEIADKKFYFLRLAEGVLLSLREPIIIILILSIIYSSRSIFFLDLDNVTLGLALFWRTYNSFFEYLSSYNNMSSYKGSYINFKSVLNKLSNNNSIENDFSKKPINCLKVSNLSYEINGKKLFENINLDLKKGDILKVNGQSGSGKSTFINVLLGLLSPYDGEIHFLDDKKNSISVRHLKIGFIDQKTVVFNDTLYNNLTLWDSITNEKISSLTKLLNLFPNQPFLKNLHDELNQKKLSGGQKQMISIIRELYVESDILILDEPTSSIDKQNSRNFYNYLKNISSDKILIIVSHQKFVDFEPTHEINLK